MTYTVREVTLPDGRRALEYEYQHHGGSEVQLSYAYTVDGKDIDKRPFKQDYWGRIEECRY